MEFSFIQMVRNVFLMILNVVKLGFSKIAGYFSEKDMSSSVTLKQYQYMRETHWGYNMYTVLIFHHCYGL